MKKVAKRAKLKTKTIVDALATLKLIPSFSTSDFGGDVLPEATLVRNIMDEMLASLTTIALLVKKLQDLDMGPIFIRRLNGTPIQGSVENFQLALKALEESKHKQGEKHWHGPESGTPRIVGAMGLPIRVEDYDADSEGPDHHHQEHGRREGGRDRRMKRRDKASSSSGNSELTHKTQHEDDRFIRTARDVLLVIQNDKGTRRQMTRMLEGSVLTGLAHPSKRLGDFIDKLHEMVEYAKVTVAIPYESHIGEVEALCGSIFMTQKFQKSVKKYRVSLEEVEKSHR